MGGQSQNRSKRPYFSPFAQPPFVAGAKLPDFSTYKNLSPLATYLCFRNIKSEYYAVSELICIGGRIEQFGILVISAMKYIFAFNYVLG